MDNFFSIYFNSIIVLGIFFISLSACDIISFLSVITQVPDSAEDWERIAQEFEKKWNYPCCIGALDGKHIAIQQPSHSGSEYFNYKHFFSVVLLALVDANYRFIYIDVGASGRAGDAGVFAASSLRKALDDNTLNLPEPGVISSQQIDFHIVGDDAFPLSTKLLKPYPHRNLDNKMKIFNYRLSRARRVVENAFGILANRFRVFLTTIRLSPDKVQSLILATCCLHNYMVSNNKHAYISALDKEDSQHTVTAGMWRSDPALTNLAATSERNPTKKAKEQRIRLTEYFMSEEGSVSWQEYMTSLHKST